MFHAGTKWLNISKDIHFDEDLNLVGLNASAEVDYEEKQNRLFIHVSAGKLK